MTPPPESAERLDLSPPFDVHDTTGRLDGRTVRVLSVASCASGLPAGDQARLMAIVGELRQVAKVDVHGFVWLSFDLGVRRDDFCLMPAEVEVA